MPTGLYNDPVLTAKFSKGSTFKRSETALKKKNKTIKYKIWHWNKFEMAEWANV